MGQGWRSRSLSLPCFSLRSTDNPAQEWYTALIKAWGALSQMYPGWTLADIKEMSHRERLIWFEAYTPRR